MKYRMLTAIGLLTIATTASAQSPFYNKMYLGVDIGRSDYKPKSYSLGLGGLLNSDMLTRWNNSASVYLGYRMERFGAEIGYTYIRRITYNTTLYKAGLIGPLAKGTMRQTGDNLYIDGIYYHALNQCFDLKGLVGIGMLHTKVSSSFNYTAGGSYNNLAKTTKPGLRLGAGAAYQISNDFSTDLMFKFQIPGNRIVKYVASVALGLAFHF